MKIYLHPGITSLLTVKKKYEKEINMSLQATSTRYY